MVDAVEAAEAAQDALDIADIAEAGDAQDQTHDGDDSTEAKATRMGWRPDGGPLGAEEFLKRGEELAPLLKANNKALEKTVKELQAKLAATDKTLNEAKVFFGKSEERAYKRALADLKAEHADAVATGDLAAAEKALDGITDLAAEMKAPKPTEAKPTAVFDAWKGDNAWFNVDEDLTAYALGLRFPDGTPEDEQFRLIAAKVRKVFPAKFENPRRAAAPAVEGASPGRKSATKGWADLPPEAKAMADSFIKQGFVKSREAYVSKYDFGA